MSPSSSGTWSGARADANILDLDRYMRVGVRPSRERNPRHERLVVDGGDIQLKAKDNNRGKAARDKRYSQDSGVSDDSYGTRDRTYRRASIQDSPVNSPRDLTTSVNRRKASSESLRAFRVVCEQALVDQQKQIAHVTQLCEKLSIQAENSKAPVKTDFPSDNVSKNSQSKNYMPGTLSEKRDQTKKLQRKQSIKSEKRKITPSDTSDITSSSLSTNDPRRKDKNRTQECKTYKIIMSKLDELNRRFPAHHVTRTSMQASPRPRSTSSVSVCDKLVATDPARTVDKIIRPTVQMVHTLESGAASPWSASAAPWGAPAACGLPRGPRVLTQAYSVDIAPRSVLNTPNVATENIIKRESSCGSGSSAGDPRFGFDLEDPVHFYSQAKRLQAMSATTRRARSVDPKVPNIGDECVSAREPFSRGRASGKDCSPSLCYMCRQYWRSLRQCLIGPFAQDCKCP